MRTKQMFGHIMSEHLIYSCIQKCQHVLLAIIKLDDLVFG